MPTLSQRLGSFPTESRAENFFLCRQDCPLPPSINRGEFHGLREEKFGSKNHKKPASLLFSFSFFPRQPFTALSTSPQLPSPMRIPTNPAYTPPQIPAPSSHRDSLSLLQTYFILFLLCYCNLNSSGRGSNHPF